MGVWEFDSTLSARTTVDSQGSRRFGHLPKGPARRTTPKVGPQLTRTAVYGPVRTAVWQGSAVTAAPMPIKSASVYKCERGWDFCGSCAHRSPLPFHPSWSAKPMLNHLINTAETASPSSQNSIAAAFFLRSSFGRDNE